MTKEKFKEVTRTVLSFDIFVNNELYSKQETFLPIVRIGSKEGLEITLPDSVLKPVHMVFHIMTGKVFIDVPYDFPSVYFKELSSNYVEQIQGVMELEPGWTTGWTISVLDYEFRNITIENCEVEEVRERKILKVIEEDIKTVMNSMGIIYSQEKDLNIPERYILKLVRKLCVYVHGSGSNVARLASETRSAIMKVQSLWNAINVNNELFYRYVIHMENESKSSTPFFTDRASYQKIVQSVVNDLSGNVDTASRSNTTVNAVEKMNLDRMRQRLFSAKSTGPKNKD